MSGLLLLGGCAAHLPGPPPGQLPPIPSVRVQAIGEVDAEADLAEIHLAVETRAASAGQAASENAGRMARVLEALRGAGVADADLRTRNYVVQTDYGRPPDDRGPPEVRGYRVANQVTVRTRALPELGGLLDRALAAGANRVDSLQFMIEDESAVRALALQRAAARARVVAEAIAQALGGRLGPVLEARTDEGSGPIAPMMMRAELADASTPIQPGPRRISAQLTVVYALQRGE